MWAKDHRVFVTYPHIWQNNAASAATTQKLRRKLLNVEAERKLGDRLTSLL